MPIYSSERVPTRGQPIDRYYMDKFLAAHSADVAGHVLQLDDQSYGRILGDGDAAVIGAPDDAEHNPSADIGTERVLWQEIPSGTFNCILCTQVLHTIYDVEKAAHTLHRLLNPGGVVLVTEAGIQKADFPHDNNGKDYWRFTSLCLRRIFEKPFPIGCVQVTAYGNVLAAVAHLHGFAAQDLRPQDLDRLDPDFEVSIGLRAVKP